MDEPVVSGMQALLTSLSAMFTLIWNQVVQVCETIVSQPLLLLTVGFLIIGGCVGIFGRLLSRN